MNHLSTVPKWLSHSDVLPLSPPFLQTNLTTGSNFNIPGSGGLTLF